MEDSNGGPCGTNQLAISNANRQTLPGPQFLDEFAKHGNEQIAINHFYDNGRTEEVSYQCLDGLSELLKTKILKLLDEDQNQNAVVPVIIPQQPALYVVYLAVLRAGAAFCPIIIDTPDERIRFIINDVQASLVICLPDLTKRLQLLLPQVDCLTVEMDALMEEYGQRAGSRFGNRCVKSSRTPADTAYVMYTSGSTGKPKGVSVSHHAITQSLLAHDEHIPSFRRFLQFAAPTFDVSIFEIFFTWLRGSVLISCDRETMLADLPAVINRQAVDAVELTPTVAATLLRKRSNTPQLNLILTIGEMLTQKVVREFGATDTDDGILYAMYGPTEASVHCTILSSMKMSDKLNNIGRPLSTVTAMIIRENYPSNAFEVLNIDQPGELVVAGQLADGYLNQPDQTSAAFVPIPKFGYVYRTGDRALMTKDGDIHILGRISAGQVKVRGQRVELGEIEEAVYQVVGVKFAVATLEDQAILLFCSCQSGVTIKDVEKRCKAWLPRHMRPNHIIVSENSPPRLDSGKIDRKRLQEMFRHSLAHQTLDSSDSLTPTEIFLLKVFQSELRTTIFSKTSLWTSGLDSLRAIRIASRSRSKLPLISVPMILDADSIADLASQLDAVGYDSSSITAIDFIDESSRWQDIKQRTQNERSQSLEEMDVEELQPCGAIQIAMLGETIRDPLINFSEVSLLSDASISFDTVVEAFQIIARKNPILRSGFISVDEPDMPFIQLTRRALCWQGEPSLAEPFKISKSDVDGKIEVKIHHALYDGWSWDLIVSDLNNLLLGDTIPDRPSYQEFRKSRHYQTVIQTDEDLSAWINYLRDTPKSIFPTLLSTISRNEGRSQAFTTLSASMESCERAARSMRVNTASIIHSAVLLLLSTYLDNDDVMSGLVLAGRDLMSSVEDVIGPCLSMLPVVARLGGISKVRDLVQHIYRQHMFCLRHSSVSLSQIKSAVGHHGADDLFDFVFVWQESLIASATDNQPVSTVSTRDHLKYAIVVEVEPKEERLQLKTSFDEHRWSLEQVETFHNQLNYYIDFIIHHLDDHLVDLSFYIPDSVRSISNTNYKKYEVVDPTFRIAQQARDNPQHLAIDFVQEFDSERLSVTRTTLTYGELHSRSRALASRLQRQYDAHKDDIIAISASKSVDAYVLICGVVISGCAYLCIDSSTPRARAHEILKEAKCKIHISDIFQQEDLPNTVLVTFKEILGNLDTDISNGLHLHPAHPSDLAYAVFTSGSTGVPKGVLITRENLASNLHQLKQIYPHKSTSRLLQSCSLAFDVSVFEIFWTWHCGMTLCSATNDVLFRDIESFINYEKITHLSMTPSVAALVNPRKVPTVEFLVCAGEPISAKVFEAWGDHGLHQGYGPSETTNICNVRNYAYDKAPINVVGPAFPNTSLFVCKRLMKANASQAISMHDFQPVVRGGVGEIWIGGAQVGRGYTDTLLTSHSWLHHPEYGILYRSGDIGRLLADGSLMILGREDDQTKIRGQRIDLVEINLKLMRLDYVADVVAMVVKDATDNDKLIAFCVLDKPAVNTTKDILMTSLEQLHEVLPSYMVPELLIPLESIPLTRQGKVDKRELQTRYSRTSEAERLRFTRMAINGHDLSPLTDEEKLVVNIVSNISGVPIVSINPHASLFTYGIDSISAITLASRLRRQGFRNIDASSIMRHSSIKRLLSHAQSQRNPPSRSKSQSIHRVIPEIVQRAVHAKLEDHEAAIQYILPCTSIQEAVLASSHQSRCGSYVNHITYRLATSIENMRRAWNILAERHQILRATFILTDDYEHTYVQAVFSTVKLPWITVEHSNSDLFSAVAGQLFYQIQLISDPSKGNEMHLFMHHALYDAEALNQIHSEIESLCRGSELPLAIPFSRYLQFGAGVDPSASHAYWQAILKSVVPCRLGQKFVLKSNKESHTTSAKATLAVSLSNLHHVASRTASTILAILQTALAKLISHYLATADVCFGTVFSGRNLPVSGVERIIGPCFNTLPTRIRIRHNMIDNDLMRSFQKFNVNSLMHQSSSLRRLQREYSSDKRPLFDVLLLLQSSSNDLDHEIWQLLSEDGQMDFPFIFEAVPIPENDNMHVYLHSTVCDDIYLQHILQDFTRLIESIIKTPISQASTIDFPLEGLSDLPIAPQNSDSSEDDQDPIMISQTPNPVSDIMETILGSIASLKEVNTQDLGSTSTIFQLGFDSISVMQLISRLRSKGIKISAGDILENPRINDFAKFCTINLPNNVPEANNDFSLEDFDLQHRPYILKVLDRAEEEIEAIWPCTPTQIGIISEHLESDGRLYYNEVRLRLSRDIDMSKLRYAFSLAVEHHSMLRTGFVEIQDLEYPYVMVVYSAKTVHLPWVDTAEVDTKSSKNSANIESLAQPPWQVVICEDGEEVHLTLRLLHALYDAHSLDVILSNVALAYENKNMLEVPPLEKALSAIISQSQSAIDSSKIVDILRPNVSATMFPDLNIIRNVRSQLLVAKLEMSMTISELRISCRRLDLTLWMACQIAWARLLAAYCGQDCVTFGAVFAGRDFNNEQLHNVAFPCMNTVPIAYNTRTSDSELLKSVRNINGQLLKNPHIPLPRIKSLLRVEDNLFDSLLVLQNFNWQDSKTALWTIESDKASAEYTLSLEVIPMHDRMTLQITYNVSRIPPAHSTLLLYQFENLLYQVLETGNHDTMNGPNFIATIPPKEPRIPSPSKTLHEMVISSAASRPEVTALEFVTDLEDRTNGRKAWTYTELIGKSVTVAQMLLRNGTAAGDLVAICFDKCPEASFAILGVIIAGCAYVAIDPAAPSSRREFIVRDARCKVVLTSGPTSELFEKVPSLLTLVIEDETLDTCGNSDILCTILGDANDTCYCLYTSGTTGEPKGCLISHDSAVQAMLSFSRIFEGRQREHSRWLQFASYHFDVSVLEHFWTWSEGLCVTVVPRDLLFEDLPKAITSLGITHLDLTPSLARLLTPENAPSLCDGVFIVGGEQVGQDIVETWGDAGCLYNFYGPSEVTIGCTVHPQVCKHTKPTNIGRQWDNVGSFVLEASSENPVLIGAVGELCLSGPLVGKGYLNRPELTDRKFITIQNSSERVYRTGDLVRMLHDHSFEFLGRIDDQIKLRGQRLEVGEINHVLLQNTDNITDVATLILRHPEQEREHLVSFLARTRKISSDNLKPRVLYDETHCAIITQMRKQATNLLPAYMVPTYFIAIDFLPLTINNKADAKTLRTLYESTGLHTVRAHQGPQDLESKVCRERFDDITQLIESFFDLNRQQVLNNSSLFQLGMDSIRAIGLSRRLKAAGFQNASVTLIMKHSVISDLANVLIHEKDFVSTNVSPMVTEAMNRIKAFTQQHFTHFQELWERQGKTLQHVCPCTPLQEGMISKLLKTSNELSPYLVKFIYQLDRSVDIVRLKAAWVNLQSRLDILRTYFMATRDGYAQVILSEAEETVHLDFMTKSANLDPFTSIGSTFDQWSRRVRHLEKALPWTVQLIEDGNGQQKYMALFLFHGLYDGQGLSLMLHAVSQEYSKPTFRTDNIMQFHEVLCYGPLLPRTDAPEFWRENVANPKLLDFPHAGDDGTKLIICSTYQNAKCGGIQDITSRLGVTPAAVFYALWLHCLANHFDTNPTIGVVFSGRSIDLEDADKIIGPMFNTVPLTINDDLVNIPLTQLIKACHSKLVDTIPFQYSSLSNIRKWINAAPDLDLFNSLFVYQDSQHRQQTEPNPPWIEEYSDSVVDYSLNIEIERMAEDDFHIAIVMRCPVTQKEIPNDLMNTLLQTLDNASALDHVLLPGCFAKVDVRPSLEHDTTLPETPIGSSDRVFQWTDETSKIRFELAMLAQVQERTIGPDTPTVFELGLDSIDALKLAARLKSKGVNIPLSKILQFPNIRGMHKQWKYHSEQTNNRKLEATANKGGYHREGLGFQDGGTSDIETILLTTPLQEGLLLHFEKYFHTLIYQVKAGTDTEKLIAAVNQTIRDLPILRTCFRAAETQNGDPYFLQVVAHNSVPQANLCALIDLDDVTSLKENLEKKRHMATLETSMPDIAIFNLKDGDSYLVLALSHASYDAWSLGLLHQHVHQRYIGSFPAEQNGLCIENYSREVREAGMQWSTTNFWSTQVKSIQPTIVPRSRQTNTVSLLKSLTSQISSADAHRVCMRFGITMQSLGLAAWTLSLMIIANQLDVTFGVLMSGRTSEETQQLIFPTFNTVLFRPNLSVDMDKKQILHRIHQLSSRIFEHQHMPLSEMMRLARFHETELFNSLFTFQKVPSSLPNHDRLYRTVDLDTGPVNPPYSVNVELEEVDGDQLIWTIAVQNGYMDRNEVQKILQQLDSIFQYLTNPGNTDIFHAREKATSICDLAPVQFVEQSSYAQPPTHGAHTASFTINGECSELEHHVREVFSEVSGTNSVDIDHNMSLFNLGLDSISAIKVSQLLSKKGIRITISQILSAQKIHSIANLASRASDPSHPSQSQQSSDRKQNRDWISLLQAASVDITQVDEVHPATGGQTYVLDMWHSSDNRMFYPEFWLRVSNCDESRFQTAWSQLVKHAPILQTRFCYINSRYHQIVYNTNMHNYNVFPWRFRIAQYHNDLLVAVQIHHALYDAVSFDRILSKLEKLLQHRTAEYTGKATLDSFTEVTCKDKESAALFWTEYLRRDTHNDVRWQGSSNAKRTTAFNPKVVSVQALEIFARREDISLQAIVFAIFGRAIAHVHQTKNRSVRLQNIDIGIWLANRSLDIDGLPDLICPTFNIVPLRVDVSSRVLEAARKIQKDLQIIGKVENCGISLREIYEWTNCHVNCFVNFLKLPTPANDDLNESDIQEERTRVEHAIGEEKAKAQALLPVDMEQELSPMVGSGMPEQNMAWSLPALDVEVKIDEEGYLAVGLFAPEDMLDETGLWKLMDEIRESVNNVERL